MRFGKKAAGTLTAGIMVLMSVSTAFGATGTQDSSSADAAYAAGVSSAIYEIMETQGSQDTASVQEGSQDASGDPEWADKAMPALEEEGAFVNVREDADENSEAIGKLYRGDGATVLEKGDQWTKISSGNLTGYVNNDYLAFGDDAKAIAEEQGSWVATVNTQTLYVREDASQDAGIAGMAAEVDELNVSTDAQAPDGWVAVEYDGGTGYVSTDYVDQQLVVGTGVTLEEEAAEQAAEQAQAQSQLQAAASNAAGTGTAASTSLASASTAKSTSPATASAPASTSRAAAATSDSVTLLAALIQCEAGGEPYTGQVAVGAVVLNRVESSAFPNTISGVIYQSGQFGPVSNGSLARTLSTGAISSSCYAAAQDALAGSDPVSGATHFGCGTSGIKIGGHYFF